MSYSFEGAHMDKGKVIDDPWTAAERARHAEEVRKAKELYDALAAKYKKSEVSATATGEASSPESISEVRVPMPPPPENQTEEEWVARYMKAAGCDRETAERVYRGAVVRFNPED